MATFGCDSETFHLTASLWERVDAFACIGLVAWPASDRKAARRQRDLAMRLRGQSSAAYRHTAGYLAVLDKPGGECQDRRLVVEHLRLVVD